MLSRFELKKERCIRSDVTLDITHIQHCIGEIEDTAPFHGLKKIIWNIFIGLPLFECSRTSLKLQSSAEQRTDRNDQYGNSNS